MITSAMDSLGTYSGAITGSVYGNLTINAGSAIQSATGDIDIRTAGDLNPREEAISGGNPYLGTIRTTGRARPELGLTYYYSYSGGGNITLNVGGNVNGSLSNSWLVG